MVAMPTGVMVSLLLGKTEAGNDDDECGGEDVDVVLHKVNRISARRNDGLGTEAAAKRRSVVEERSLIDPLDCFI